MSEKTITITIKVIKDDVSVSMTPKEYAFYQVLQSIDKKLTGSSDKSLFESVFGR